MNYDDLRKKYIELYPNQCISENKFDFDTLMFFNISSMSLYNLDCTYYAGRSRLHLYRNNRLIKTYFIESLPPKLVEFVEWKLWTKDYMPYSIHSLFLNNGIIVKLNQFSPDLYESFSKNDEVKIQEFLNKGHNINSPNYNGFNLLSLTIKEENIDKILLLIKYGADVNISGNKMPLLYQALNVQKAEKIINILLQNGSIDQSFDGENLVTFAKKYYTKYANYIEDLFSPINLI